MALFTHTPQEVVQQDASPPLPSAPRALYLAEMSRGYAKPPAFLLVPGLSAGDVAPTAEPNFEETVFFDGTRTQVRAGTTYPSKVWTLRLPDTHPLMVLLFRYVDDSANVARERGRVLAYNAFHPDRSGVKGELKVANINPVGEGSHSYLVTVLVVSRWPFPSSLNLPPLPDLPPVVVLPPPVGGLDLYLETFQEVY